MLLLNTTEDLVKLQLWFLNVKRVCEMSFHLITLPAFKKCKCICMWMCIEILKNCILLWFFSRAFKMWLVTYHKLPCFNALLYVFVGEKC